MQSTFDGIRRMLARLVQKKKLLSKEMLEKVVVDKNKNSTLSNIRLATACLLAFASFLRFDELVQLRPFDTEIDKSMAKLRIRQSKTNQIHKGDEVLIARTGSHTCPVTMLERFMAKAGISSTSKQFLLRAITRTARREVFRAPGSISYARLREL